MSMSTYVYGIKPPNEKWKKMSAAYNACKEAKVSIPVQLETFFGGDAPDPKGVIIDLTKYDGVVSEHHGEGESGFIIDLSKLPKDITELRFVNSW